MTKNPVRKKAHIAINNYQTEKLIASVLVKLFDPKKAVFIAVSGPGGSGKTSFSKKLASLLPDAGIISLDNYKKSRKVRLENDTWGPHPDANRIDLIVEHLSLLRDGSTIEIPIYDIVSGDSQSREKYRPRRFNIIEGEIALNSQIRDMFDFSIFIDSDLTTQLKTRLDRDIRERGHSYQKAITNFLKSNVEEFKEYGADDKMWSDVHIYCHHDYNLVLEAVDNKFIELFTSIADKLKQVSIEGLIVPLTTPFNSDGTICKKAFIDHLEWLYSKGVSRILVSGTTAEFFSMTADERIEILDIAREYFAGMILFQAGCESLVSTISLVQRAVRHGADAIMVLPPYYFNSAPEKGLIQYFKEVSKVCEVPFILYNFPKHTGNPITSSMLKEIPHDGIKDSSAECELIPFTSCFLVGSSTKIVQAVRAGAKGFVSAMANCFAERYVEIEKKLKNGEYEKALEIQASFVTKKTMFEGKQEIVQLKQILSSIIDGYPSHVRLPLVV